MSSLPQGQAAAACARGAVRSAEQRLAPVLLPATAYAAGGRPAAAPDGAGRAPLLP